MDPLISVENTTRICRARLLPSTDIEAVYLVYGRPGIPEYFSCMYSVIDIVHTSLLQGMEKHILWKEYYKIEWDTPLLQ